MVNEVTASDAFDNAARQQLRELIKQNFNHPSIFFWSVLSTVCGSEKRSMNGDCGGTCGDGSGAVTVMGGIVCWDGG